MIVCKTLCEIKQDERLYRSLFSERTRVFSNQLGWNKDLNSDGFETDYLDDELARYIIFLSTCGKHIGSIRVRVCDDTSMIAVSMPRMFKNLGLEDLNLVEASRFLVSTQTPISRRLVRKLLAQATYSFALRNSYSGIAAIFNRPLLRVYSSIGWKPYQIFLNPDSIDEQLLGIWSYEDWSIGELTEVPRVVSRA